VSSQIPLGELTALPGPLAGFKWPTYKGEGERKEKGWKEREGNVEFHHLVLSIQSNPKLV